MKKPSKNWPGSDVTYVSIEEIVAIHERMLAIGKGREGIRDFTLLHSACERPKATFAGKMLYSNIWLQAASLLQSLVKNHPFTDGNKRTGFFSSLRFLNLNGIDIKAHKAEIIDFCLSVNTRKLNIEEIASWLPSIAN